MIRFRKKLILFCASLLLINYPFDLKASENIDLINQDKYEIEKDFYILGAGDIINIKFINNDEFSGNFQILVDGTISLPFAGIINIEDFTLKQAQKKIQDLLKKELLNPYIQITIIKKRPIKVSVIGEVNRSGLYFLNIDKNQPLLDNTAQIVAQNKSSFPTLLDAIQTAGGITKKANIKEVLLKRRLPGVKKEYKLAKFDLTDLILNGTQIYNPYLYDGDIIKIQKVSNNLEINKELFSSNLTKKFINIHVIGEVKNPGKQEVLNNTSLSRAIMIAGGPKSWRANKGSVEILKLKSNGSAVRKRYKININNNESSKTNPALEDGDIVFVKSNLFANTSDGIKVLTNPLTNVFQTWTLINLIND